MRYSQFGEEDIIWSILEEIGDGTKVCTDIGARLNGSNVARLIEERGYAGNLVDVSEDSCKELREKFPQANVQCVKATIDNINTLVPRETHVLSIDIDSHDWWLWANLIAKPSIIIIETNPCKGIMVAEYGASRKSAKGYGCSMDAVAMLAEWKGYRIAATTEANAVCVQKQTKYQGPRYPGHGGRPSSSENNVFR